MAILEAAVAVAAGEIIQTPDVWEALDTLAPHCAERWPIKQFWRDAGYETDHPSARYQGCNAAFRGIERQLRIAGKRWSGDTT